MVYVIPQVQVFQDFNVAPNVAETPLQAHISGGNAQLIRYAQSTEQAFGLVGIYDPLDDLVISWPSRPAGGVVDQSYTKLFIQNAILRYFDSGQAGVTDIASVAGKFNQIHSNSFNFATNGTYARDTSLYDRDVQVGDLIKLRWDIAGGITQWSYVNGLLTDPVGAVIGTVISDTGNQTTSSATASVSQTRGPYNAVKAVSASAASYDPYPTGAVNEQYTLIVTTSSTGGNLPTAQLRVISASGLDDQAILVPSARGTATPVGTRGVTVTFNLDSGGHLTADSDSADVQGVSPDDLIAGMRFVVNVTGAFAAPTPQANDTAGHATTPYTGVADTLYIVTVTKGGKFANGGGAITVTTDTGSDVSGPTAVTVSAAVTAVGTKGVTISFTGTGLALGERYYIPATAQTNGRVSTVVLGNNIPAQVTSGTIAEVQLFIKKPVLEVDQDRIGFAPLTNFDMTDIQLTIHSGIEAYDPTWTQNGIPLPLPLESDAGQAYSQVYLQARYWLPTLANQVNGIDDVANIDQIPGALDVDNPLKWGVFKALENSNGTMVMYTAVTDPTSLDAWVQVLSVITGRDDVYGLVPLTHDVQVQNLFAAHVDDQSSPEQDLWRVAWFSLTGIPTIPIVSAGSEITGYLAATTTDGNVALGTISADPDAIGTEYTIVIVPAANAGFITNAVQSGDVVRTFYGTDGYGNETYQEYVIDVVQSEDQLRLLSGPSIAVSHAQRIEVWRNLSTTDEAAAIGKAAGSWGDRRIRAVWPDQIGSGGTLMDGFFLCCSLAGLSAGVVPQQGLTNLAITGYDDLSRTTSKFNSAQLNTMAGSGVWIVTQSPAGEVYSRHALTTGSYADINQREEMVTRNVDSISYQFANEFAPYIGVCNVTPSMQALLANVVGQLVSTLNVSIKKTLGPQLIDAQIVSLQPSLLLADRYVLLLNITIPYPLNVFEIHLIV